MSTPAAASSMVFGAHLLNRFFFFSRRPAPGMSLGASPKDARHYACMDFDGEDLVILSRSADNRDRRAHDGNLITFYLVREFRALVY